MSEAKTAAERVRQIFLKGGRDLPSCFAVQDYLAAIPADAPEQIAALEAELAKCTEARDRSGDEMDDEMRQAGAAIDAFIERERRSRVKDVHTKASESFFAKFRSAQAEGYEKQVAALKVKLAVAREDARSARRERDDANRVCDEGDTDGQHRAAKYATGKRRMQRRAEEAEVRLAVALGALEKLKEYGIPRWPPHIFEIVDDALADMPPPVKRLLAIVEAAERPHEKARRYFGSTEICTCTVCKAVRGEQTESIPRSAFKRRLRPVKLGLSDEDHEDHGEVTDGEEASL